MNVSIAVIPAQAGPSTAELVIHLDPLESRSKMDSRLRGNDGSYVRGALLLMIVAAVSCGCAPQSRPPIPTDATREHISIDFDWRFHKGDPDGLAVGALDYDVRPKVERIADGKIADAKPDATALTAT